MTLRSLRRFAFLATLIIAVTFALVLAARLALDGPSIRLGLMTTGVFAVLLALAGIHARLR